METRYVLRSLPDDTGFEVRTKLGMPGTLQDQLVRFDNYYLRNWIFEEAAKSGGLDGGLEWQALILTEDIRRVKVRGYWDLAVTNPRFRFSVMRKQA